VIQITTWISIALLLSVFALLTWMAARTVPHLVYPHTPSRAKSPAEGAISIARNRLLAGEIDRSDFERIARVLSS